MKSLLITILLAVSIVSFSQSKKELEAQIAKLKAEIEQLKKPKEVELVNANKKAGYGMGVLIATNIKSQGGDSLDVEALSMAFRDIFTGKTPKMDQQQCMTEAQQYMQQAIEKKNAAVIEVGKKFLEENKSKEGVTTTSSGLQYKVLTQGSGKMPSATDNVTVHYTGRLIDGTVFDSSVRRGQPATFSLTQVIRGWVEALQLMKEGDKWMVVVPAELGYGERGMGSQIPPHATLIFEIELIKVN